MYIQGFFCDEPVIAVEELYYFGLVLFTFFHIYVTY